MHRQHVSCMAQASRKTPSKLAASELINKRYCWQSSGAMLQDTMRMTACIAKAKQGAREHPWQEDCIARGAQSCGAACSSQPDRCVGVLKAAGHMGELLPHASIHAGWQHLAYDA